MLILDIVVRNLKQVLRSPGQITLIIAFPIAFILVFAFMFGSGSIVGDSSSPIIAVVNHDNFNATWGTPFNDAVKDSDQVFAKGFGNYFLESLEDKTELKITNRETTFRLRNYGTVEKAKEEVKAGSVILAIILPEDFSKSILARINYRINLTEGAPVTVDPEFTTTNATVRIYGNINNQDFQEVQSEVSESINHFVDYYSGVDFEGGYLLKSVEGITTIRLSSFDYQVPGFLIFAIVVGAASIGHLVGTERKTGTLDRLRISQLSSTEYLIGLTISQLITLSVQIAIMLGAAYLFGFKAPGNPVYAFIVLIITIIPVLGVGLIIASLDRSGEQASGIAAILSAPIGFLSGAFVPLPNIVLIPNIIPKGTGGVRDLFLWDLFPFASATKALRLIFIGQYDLLEVLPEIVLLCIGGLIFFLIGTFLFITRVFTD